MDRRRRRFIPLPKPFLARSEGGIGEGVGGIFGILPITLPWYVNYGDCFGCDKLGRREGLEKCVLDGESPSE